MIARHEASTGKRTWQRRFTARDAKCVSPDCAGKDQFGGAAVRGTSVLYCATVDKPVEEAFGELSLAKGAPIKSYPSRSDLRAHDIAADAGGIYLLEETLSGAFSLVKLGAEKTEWKQSITSGALRFSVGDAGALLWGKTVEKRATDSGELAWTSKLTGEHIDVAADASGIYATVMIDAKPAPYFAIAQIDPASGDVRWLRKTSGYEETRPTAYIASDKDWIYLFGFEGDKWFVERRRKSDGALGEVTTTTRTVETKAKRK
jgi:hypothetical protein